MAFPPFDPRDRIKHRIGTPFRITASALIYTGPGMLLNLAFPAQAGTITVRDGLDASGTIIRNIDTATVGRHDACDIVFQTGLFIQLTTAADASGSYVGT